MNRQAFVNLLKDPKNITFQDLHGLEEVIANFPYCQAAHILAAKGAHDNGRMLSDKKIRIAAAYASERTNLKGIILQEALTEQAPPKIVLKEEIQPITLPNKDEIQPAISSSEIKEKTDRVEEVKTRETDTASNEKTERKSVNDKFFAELEKNLRSLRSSKEKAAKGSYPAAGKEVEKESSKKEEEDLILPHLLEQERESGILLQEPIKEHTESVHLFSSRLDEVVEEKDTAGIKPLISEGELLLNYLSFLENHKNSAVKDKKKTEEIIEKFIKQDPSIPYMNSKTLPDEQEDKASQSYRLKGGLVSENMANIYVSQGKKDRAIEIYQQLMLKNPEKRAYFVSQIEKIKGN